MTALNWDIQQMPGGTLAAHGEDWTYLIMHDDRAVVMTRFHQGPDYREVAAQAARYAIQIGGAYDEVPEAAAGVIAHMKRAAQVYESGGDVTGQPAWRHKHQEKPAR